ncbi:hypothetical protein F383_39297 [Gossypium arboreum]|nr:hypothetical protein F383_39297 [Gossypium arboreum]
MSWGSR